MNNTEYSPALFAEILKRQLRCTMEETLMSAITMSMDELRAFLVAYQGFASSKPLASESGIVELVKRIGCIQYDPLNVVGHNPDLMLQSRFVGYDPVLLDRLLYQRRELVDGWDKMMAIYSVHDWPYFYRVRARKKEETEGTLAYRGSLEAIQYVDTVRVFIETNGAVSPAKLDLGRVANGRWGHGKLSSAAMDYMWNTGTLSVKEKRNTHKIYDLTERVLPKEIVEQADPFDSDHAFYKWYFKRRIGSLGAYWGRNGGGWLGHFVSDNQLRAQVLQELCEEGSLLRVKVEGLKEAFYMRMEDQVVLNAMCRDTEPTVTILAPLDNLLWDRKLIKDVFNFEYSWEVYRPAAARKYGYYVLPVLYGDRLVARFEPEKHLTGEPLKIANWWWEEGFEAREAAKEAVMKALREFCLYLKADGLDKEFGDKF